MALALYAWRDWYLSLCGVVVLSALAGHPDMPGVMFGLPGLDPLNVCLLAILVPWWVERQGQGKSWDVPRPLNIALGLYVGLVFVSYLRAIADLDSFPAIAQRETGIAIYTLLGVTYDYLINPLKYMLPAVLLFDGCRSRRRMAIGLAATLLMAVLYSGLVMRTVSISGLQQTGKAEMHQRHRIGKRVGFHANSVAMLMVIGAWGILGALPTQRRVWAKVALVAAALVVALGILMTRSRAGYVAFACMGLIFGVLLWRRHLFWSLVGVFLVIWLFPGVMERMTTGLNAFDASGEQTVDMTELTASRSTIIWPPVLRAIAASPIVGHGRLGILRTSAYGELVEASGGCPTHPHNAYLEALLDAGVIGLLIIGFLYFHLIRAAYRLCRAPRDPLFNAVGAGSLAAACVLLLMGLTGASFFPKENGQMSWCLFGLALRATAVRQAPSAAPANSSAGHFPGGAHGELRMTTAPQDAVMQSRAAAYDGIYRLSQVKRVTVESYERWARYFLDAPPGERGHINGNEICFALSRLGVDQLAGKRVLDYCCGVGRSSIYFALRGARVSAFDASAQAIDVAKESARLSGVADRTDFRIMDAQDLAYDSGTFDAAYCQSSLHIIIDYPRCATELARVLKSGARAVFCEEPLGHNPLVALFRAFRRRRYKRCGGRELRYADIRRFGRPFARTEITHFNLLSQLKTSLGQAAYWPAWRAVLSHVDALDRRLLSSLPFLRRLSGKVAVEFAAGEAPRA